MRNTMLVEIESFFGDRLISGKKYSLKELREKVKRAMRRADMTGEDFTTINLASCIILKSNLTLIMPVQILLLT